MTDNEFNSRYDFLCERRLRQTDAKLHSLFKSSVFSIDLLLANYKNIFPFFTDHTFEHSEQVINYCNIIAGEEIISSLNADEIYILLMGATLHDVGMGISEADFKDMADDIPGLIPYMQEHPDEPIAVYTRAFHQEFSAQFIKKYRHLFDVPSEEYTHCIAMVARGHRKADLLCCDEYPPDYPLPNGNRVNLAYLAALVKLADELDITSDRNLLFDYRNSDKFKSAKQVMCFKCHNAIKKLGIREESLVLYYDAAEKDVEEEIRSTHGKVNNTFSKYCAVVDQRTDFKNRLKEIVFEQINK